MIRVLFWCYLFFLVFADATAINPADPDLWHRLALGEYLFTTGHFPLGSTFSYLADFQHVADHEWGSALIFYALYHGLGGAAIVGMKLVMLGATLTLIVWAGLHGRRPTVLLAAFYALVLLALLPSFQSAVRCMTFTHLFLALWLYWFQLERHGRLMRNWPYVLTLILWANLHGGFALGLLWLAGLAVVDSERRPKWIARFVLGGLATLINPFGWQLWISTARALTTTRHGFGEWSPVSWVDLGYLGYKLLVISVLISMIILVCQRGWPRLDRLAFLLISAALALSLTSARHTSILAVVAGALLPDFFPEALTDFPREESAFRRRAALAGTFFLLLLPLFAALEIFPGDGFTLHEPTNSCPVGAVAFLEGENVHGRLLVPFNYGSYALWKLRGRMRVSMDGRYDLVYLPETYQKVDDFFSANGDWSELLHSPRPNAILLPKTDVVYPRLQGQTDWREAYDDERDAVFLPR